MHPGAHLGVVAHGTPIGSRGVGVGQWARPVQESDDLPTRWVSRSVPGMPQFVERADGSGHRAVSSDASLLSEFRVDAPSFHRFLVVRERERERARARVCVCLCA